MNTEHLGIARQGATAIAAWRTENPNVRLNLRGADLGGADLWGANLGRADLRGADLRSAYLGGANLRGADLWGANLGRANLGGADLWGADLGRVYLGDNRILQIGPTGSRRDYLVVKWGPDLDEVMAGCFMGTLAEFEASVQKTHGDNAHGREYRAIIAMLKQLREEKT